MVKNVIMLNNLPEMCPELIQKTAEITSDLIGIKISNKITKF